MFSRFRPDPDLGLATLYHTAALYSYIRAYFENLRRQFSNIVVFLVGTLTHIEEGPSDRSDNNLYQPKQLSDLLVLRPEILCCS